jgi:hypothetical protein
MKPFLLFVLLLSFAPACASAPPIVNAANTEHIAVTAVHAVIQAEAAAFKAGAYDNAKHQTYVAALLKVGQSEKALNDALKVWNASSGQSIPTVVAIAIQNISTILADVTPLLGTNQTLAALASTASVAIQALAGGK